MGHKLALLIGNGTYSYWNPLRKSAVDVRALGQTLENPYIGAFHNVQILIDESVEIIRGAISDFFLNKRPDDVLLLYLTGHGISINQPDWFFVCKETPKEDIPKENLDLTAISASFIRECMDKCRAESQIIIIDACDAAAFASKFPFGIQQMKRVLFDVVAITNKGTEAQRVGQLLEETSGSGHVILAATGPKDVAVPGKPYFPTSVFTYYLVQGLITGAADKHRTGQITVDDWFTHACRYVPKENIYQQPRKENVGNQRGSIIIARNPVLVRNSNDAYEQHHMAYIRYKLSHEIPTDVLVGFERALHGYDERLRAAPREGIVWLNKGNVLFHLGRYEEALNAYEMAVELLPDNAIAWHNQGCALYQLSRYNEALMAYEKACNLDPSESEIWYNLGHAFFDLHMYKDASDMFGEASKLNPTDPKVWTNLGFAFSLIGEEEAAEDAKKKAYACKFPVGFITFGTGVILERTFWNKEAISVLKIASELTPDTVSLWGGKGDLLAQEERYEEAIEAYKEAYAEALNYVPDGAIQWHHKGTAFLQIGKYKAALAAYEEALKAAPDEVTTGRVNGYGASGFAARVWYEKGYALLQLRKNKEALIALQEALNLTSPDLIARSDGKEFVPSSHGNVWIDKTQRRQDGSIELGDTVTGFTEGGTPDDFVAVVWFNIGSAFYNLKQYEEAHQAFENTCDLMPDNAAAHWRRGRALWKLERYEEAKEAFNSARTLKLEMPEKRPQILTMDSSWLYFPRIVRLFWDKLKGRRWSLL